jgi:hypothetical protein
MRRFVLKDDTEAESPADAAEPDSGDDQVGLPDQRPSQRRGMRHAVAHKEAVAKAATAKAAAAKAAAAKAEAAEGSGCCCCCC